MIIMNLLQETTVFGGRQKLTSAMKQKEHPEVRFYSKKVNRKFVLVGGTVRANPT